MSRSISTLSPGHIRGAERLLTVGETQILTADEAAMWKAEAGRRGQCVNIRPATYGAGKLFIVRTFATADDLDEFLSRHYLGLPLVVERACR